MKFLTDIQIEPLDYSHCRIGSCGRNAAHEVTAAYSDGTADMVRCCNDCLPQAIMGVAVYDCDLDESLVRAAGDLLAALEGMVDIIDHGGPHGVAPGHICGPDAMCDQDCAVVSDEQETLDAARAAIAKARGAK